MIAMVAVTLTSAMMIGKAAASGVRKTKSRIKNVIGRAMRSAWIRSEEAFWFKS